MTDQQNQKPTKIKIYIIIIITVILSEKYTLIGWLAYISNVYADLRTVLLTSDKLRGGLM